MTDPFEIDPQGGSEFMVRLRGDGVLVPAQPRAPRGARCGRGRRGAGAADRPLPPRHQDAADFPDIVEVEDVAAAYPDYLDAVRG